MNKLIIILVLLLLVSIFAVLNSDVVDINLFFIQFRISLALVIIVSALFGAIIAFVVSLLDRFKKYKKTDVIKKNLQECEAKLQELEASIREKETNEIVQEQVE